MPFDDLTDCRTELGVVTLTINENLKITKTQTSLSAAAQCMLQGVPELSEHKFLGEYRLSPLWSNR